ncbi:lipid A biosynthesis acyltransferase [Xylophilus sp. GOD-11R]|uniref:lysophospholipid acyltransferase family protein n=1 Tax=Xylophilus sp. GOD-11R TaxID=3089814 RepID=UPI00298CF8A3|nr:lipid A biosynthesis acyltransferase [Xylophilus sp. GOD-11R]WPB57562.1 lipid A biosynthesis acyltransferase [Xylophilus sp. GOD-11R]
MSRIAILLMRCSAVLPLRAVRALGWLLGMLLYALVRSRRHVVDTNLRLCFAHLSDDERRRMALRTFVAFGQSWMDRGWLWHAAPAVVERRLVLTGAIDELAGDAPTILFAPHFYGLDAAATAIAIRVPRRYTSIYAQQADTAVDDWIKAGRLRFGDCRVFSRTTGLKEIVASLRAGDVFYLLPDMDFGPDDSVFVPFFGIQAATLPSVARFARLGRAKVVTVLSRITPQGYTVELLPAWQGFPGEDPVADTALMNRRLEGFIEAMPEQYYWVHKRFKTRPPGEPSVY